MDMATGALIAVCKPMHLQQEFLGFLRRIDKEAP